MPQCFTGGHADHFFDKIQTGNQFGHRMFNLKPRVHFQKIEIPVSIDDKFNSPGAMVINRHCQTDCFVTHGLSGGFIQKW